MNKLEVWTKPIGRDAKEMAFAFLNFEDRGGPTHVSKSPNFVWTS